MSGNNHEEKVNLNAELKKCLNYLRDKETELPDHLKQTDLSILSTQEQMTLIRKRLSEIEAQEAEVAAKEKQHLASSLKKVEKMKTKLSKVREELDKEVKTLHHQHKALFFEFSKALSQMRL